MNNTMIRHLALKDWRFNRWIIAAYMAGGALALGMIGLGGTTLIYVGGILLVTVLIAVGVHMVIGTVVYERKDQTLPFVMSLPISAREYTAAKILSNLLIFLAPWCALTVGSIWVVLGREGLPDGLVPFLAVVLGELLAAWSLVLATAIVTESEGWTIVVMVLCNLFFNYFLYWVVNQSQMAETMNGPEPVWNAFVFGALGAELAAMLLIFAVTFFLQSRKRDFL